MFKKVGYIFLASLMILSTMGFVISKHYCNNELISVSLDIPSDNCCEEPNSDCCHNENITFVLGAEFIQYNASQVNESELFIFISNINDQFNEYFDHGINKTLITTINPIRQIHKQFVKIQSFLL